jgi:replicative DNA helicase
MSGPTPRESAEVAVLGAVLLSETALGIIADERLRPEHFWNPLRREVFAAMLELSDAGHRVDEITLKAKFAGSETITPGHIELLTAAVPNIGSLRDYCRIVREGAWFDQAAAVLMDAGDALSRQDRASLLAALRRLDESEDVEPEQDTASEFMDWYDREQKGWPLPFSRLTATVGGGLLPGEVTVVGAWSGFGKTIWISQMLRETAAAGARSHEYANEMYGPKRTAA